jgi:replicative DNA helicase
MCRRSGCNAERLRDHCLSPAEVLKVQAIAKAALPVPVYMDAIGVEVEEIVAQLHQIIPQERIDLVLVDYIQSIHCRSLKQDRRTEVAFVAKELTDAIKACGAAGILFTQLTIESRIAIPSLHNVRDSKDVSHGAETIILGYEASSSVNGPDGVQMAVEGDKLTLCDKVKNGTRGGIIRHDWDTETASFKRVLRPVPGNYPPQYEPEERPAARAQRELRQAELWTGFDNDGARYGETQDRE